MKSCNTARIQSKYKRYSLRYTRKYYRRKKYIKTKTIVRCCGGISIIMHRYISVSDTIPASQCGRYIRYLRHKSKYNA